jgi:hypothetical protein
MIDVPVIIYGVYGTVMDEAPRIGFLIGRVCFFDKMNVHLCNQDSIEYGNDLDAASWGMQEGVLITANEARQIVEALEGKTVDCDCTEPEGFANGTVCPKCDRLFRITNTETNWISVEDRLPENFHLNMSRDVLTIAGKYKMKVSSYDYELKRWNGYNHVSPTHWQPLPTPPHL